MNTLLKIGICTLPIAIIFLLVTRILVANNLASAGEKFKETDREISRLSDENELLRQQVASLSSLIAIEVRAKELGFIEPSRSQIISVATDDFSYALR